MANEKWYDVPVKKEQEVIRQKKKEWFPNASDEDWGILGQIYLQILNTTKNNQILIKDFIPFLKDKTTAGAKKFCQKFHPHIISYNENPPYIQISSLQYFVLVSESFSAPRETRDWFPYLEKILIQNQQDIQRGGGSFSEQELIDQLTNLKSIDMNNESMLKRLTGAYWVPQPNLISFVVSGVANFLSDGKGLRNISLVQGNIFGKTAQEWYENFLSIHFNLFEQNAESNRHKKNPPEKEKIFSSSDSNEISPSEELGEFSAISSILHPDHGEKDLLDYSLYATAITSFLTKSSTKPPISIGVFAPWGNGKTFLINDVKKKIEKDFSRRKEGQLEYPTVFLKAWKYDSQEQVWAGIISEIFDQVLKIKLLKWHDKGKFWFRFFLKRFDLNDLIFDFFKVGLCVSIIFLISFVFYSVFKSGNQHFLDFVNSWFAVELTSAMGILTVFLYLFKSINESIFTGVGRYLKRFGHEDKKGYFSEIENDLKNMLEILVSKEKPLVIFVDDLDRCATKSIVEVFESIHRFMNGEFPGCIFVIGADPQIIVDSIETVYEDHLKNSGHYSFNSFGWSFIDKFVQLPFFIPNPDFNHQDKYLKNLVLESDGVTQKSEINEKERLSYLLEPYKQGDFKIEKLIEEVKEKLSKGEHDEELLMENVIKVSSDRFKDDDPEFLNSIQKFIGFVGFNPRLIKKFANLYRFHSSLQIVRRTRGRRFIQTKKIWFYISVMLCWPELLSWVKWGGKQYINSEFNAQSRARVVDDFVRGTEINNFKDFKEKLEGFGFKSLAINNNLFRLLKDLQNENGSLVNGLETGVW
jgi:hypothetical protein